MSVFFRNSALSAAQAALEVMRAHPLGAEAAIIGQVRADPPGLVFLRTEIGGTRVLDMLVGDPLPLTHPARDWPAVPVGCRLVPKHAR